MNTDWHDLEDRTLRACVHASLSQCREVLAAAVAQHNDPYPPARRSSEDNGTLGRTAKAMMQHRLIQ